MGKFAPGTPKPFGSGRKKGTPQKLTEEVRRLAKQHGPEVIARFAEIALSKDGDQRAAVMAGKELLDRAYGKATPLSLDEGGTAGTVRVVISGDDSKL